MKPIDEQIILVTGSTDGIGKLAARDLAKRGATVILHGRDLEKGETVLRVIREDTGNHKLSFHLADFSSLSEVRRLADEIEAGFPALDVLINNAGVGIGKPDEKKRMLSRDGYELRFAVNYLAPFLLTQLLLPSLRKASLSRIVNVSSAAQSAIDFDDLMLEDGYDPMEAYSRSKLALAMFTFELAERVQDEKITVNCMHPGSLLDTKMVRESFSRPRGSAQSGADVEVNLAVASELEGVTGRYFERMNEAKAHPQAYKKEARKKLWELSLKLTGLPT